MMMIFYVNDGDDDGGGDIDDDDGNDDDHDGHDHHDHHGPSEDWLTHLASPGRRSRGTSKVLHSGSYTPSNWVLLTA